LSEKKSEFDDSKAEESVESLNPNVQTGLNSAEVEERLKRFGFNEVSEKKPSAVLAFLRKFWGLTSWMLEIIIALSWFLKDMLTFTL
jgi:H+-transporting ATPase